MKSSRATTIVLSVWEPFILNSGLVARRDQPPPADAAVQCSLKCSGVAWWLLSVTTGTPAGCWLSTWHASKMQQCSLPAQRASIRTQTLDWDPDPARIATARRRTWKGDPTLDARALSRIRGDTTCAGSVAVLVAVVWREPSRKLALGFPVLRLRYCLRLGRTRRCGL